MANLVELFDNIVQMQNLNGVPLANGKLYVYALGRTRLMNTWSDVDGESLNTNPIILDDAGQAHCFVSDDFDYTLVVKDAYDNEIFSIDKYLYSKGEHSHADVAVAPSEHIGVSSYHVGETTVYVPYIQGELGKTYHGIEPIVVNNQENKISARNIPLGVQSPLYFAEDSESACIIGMSGEYQPVTGMSGYATTGDLVDLATSVSETYQPKGDYATHDDLSGFMEESKLETADGKITGYDGTAFAGGGSDEFIPWSASGNFATSGDLNDKLDTTAFSTVSGDFITAIPDTYASKDFVLSSVSSKLDSTAFSTVSGNFLTALPEGILNESGFEYDGDKISAYNGSAFVGQGGSELSGYELSAGNGISIDNYPIEQKTVISVTGNYATEDWVTGQGYLTAETDWTDTITAASANAYEQATAAIPAPFDPTYLSGQIDTKLDSAIYANDSGTFLTAHQDISDLMPKSESANFYPMTGNPSGFLTAHQSLADYQTIEGMTAYQPVGDYLTTGDSANFYTTANESGFITGVDLTPYQTIEGMTAYQEAGDYYSASNPSGFITGVPDTYLQNTDLTISDGKITEISGVPLSAGDELPESVSAATDYVTANSATINGTVETVSSNSGSWGGEALPLSSRDGIDLEIVGDTLYIGASALTASIDEKLDASVYATDSGSFLTAHQSLDGYLQNTDLEISDNKITGISGVPLAAGGGGDVPEGVMAESGLEYNAVDEISGYNGSAFAQYGAEKQWLVHDDTLVHASNSAQYALGVNLSAVAQLLGIDETVLYNNLTGRPTTVGSYIDLSESPLNFTEIAIYLNGSSPTGSNNISNGYEKVPVEQLSSSNGLEFIKEFAGTVAGAKSTVHDMGCGYSGTSGTRWTKWYGYSYNVENKTTDFNNSTHLNIWKVVGIGRKS